MMAGPSFPTLSTSTSTSIDSKPKPIRPLLERRRRWTEPNNNNNNHVNNLSITTSPTRFKDSTMISSKELEDLTLLFKIQRKGGAESQTGSLNRPRRRHTTSNQHYNGRERGRTHQRSESFNGNNLNVVRDQVDQKSKSLGSRIVSPSSNSRDQTSTSKDQTHFQFKPSKPTFSLSLLDEDGNEIDSEEEEEMMDDYLLTPRASKFNSTFVSPSPTSVTPRASTFNLNAKSKTMERLRPSSSSSQSRREEMGGSLMGGMEQLRECGRFKDDEEEKRVVGLGPKSDENQDADNEEEEESVEDEFTDFDSVVDVEHDDEETVNNSNWIPFDSKISTSSKISSTANWISKTIEDRTSSLSRTSSCNSISSFHSCFEDDSDSDSDSDSSDSDQEEEEKVEEEDENDEDNEWETLIPTKGSFLSTRRNNSSDIQVTKSLDSNITRPKIHRSSKFGSTSSLSSLGEDEKDGRIRARPLEEVKLTLPVWKCDEW